MRITQEMSVGTDTYCDQHALLVCDRTVHLLHAKSRHADTSRSVQLETASTRFVRANPHFPWLFCCDTDYTASASKGHTSLGKRQHWSFAADDEVSGAHAAVLPPASAPDSPRSSTLDLSTRLSNAHSTADGFDADDTSGPQAAPASSNSSLTQGNLAVIAARSNSMAQQPSASVSSQAGSFSTTGQQQRTEQAQPSPVSVRGTALPSDALATAPSSSIAEQAPQSPGGRTKRSAASAVQPQTCANSDSIPQQQQQADGLSAIPQGVDGTSRTLLQQPSIGRSAADAAFATWVTAEGHAEWAAVEYLGSQALLGLIMALRMVAPHTDTEALR